MRVRRPGQRMRLAKAGQRVELFESASGAAVIDTLRFDATVLDGKVAGRVDIEDAAGQRTESLAAENRIEGTALRRVSVVPAKDTAITIVRDGGTSPLAVWAGALLILAALGWTTFETFG